MSSRRFRNLEQSLGQERPSEERGESTMKRKSKVYPDLQSTAVIDWTLNVPDASTARRAIANKWLEENPYTKYRCNVERCEDGSRVYLLRPTWLNKGFDFMVNVEGFRSRIRLARGPTKEMPSHADVINDLLQKIRANPEYKNLWYDAVCAVYDCLDPPVALKRHGDNRLRRPVGLPADTLLYIMKWLFIEQDVTYWLYTGRDKLMNAMETEVFSIL